MAGFYDDMQSIARDVIGQFAQGSITYVVVTPGTGAADDPGAPTETSYSINAVVRGVSFKYVNDTTIVRSDLQLTMPVVAGEPAPTMAGFIKIGSTRYKIVEIRTIPPAGTAVAHVVIFRR